MGKQFFKNGSLIVLGGLLGLALSVFIGDRLAGRLSSVPILRQYKLVTTQAPIVIRTTEEIRSRGDEDVISALEKSKRRVSAVLRKENNQLSVVGNSLNLSGDGLFLSALPEAVLKQELYVQLSDGNLRAVSKVEQDTASGLVFLTASGGGSVSPVSFATAGGVRPAERLLLLAGGKGEGMVSATVTFAFGPTVVLDDAEAGMFNQRLPVENGDSLKIGSAVVNMSGDVVGLATSRGVLPGEVLDVVTKKYLSEKSLSRLAIGFAFHSVNGAEAKLFGLPQSALVVLRVLPDSPAGKAGLKPGDSVVAVDGKTVSNTNADELFVSLTPSKTVELKVMRNKTEVKLNLTPVVVK